MDGSGAASDHAGNGEDDAGNRREGGGGNDEIVSTPHPVFCREMVKAE